MSRIKRIFEVMSPDDIGRRVKLCFEKATKSEIDCVEKLFPERLFPMPKEKDSKGFKHCLRCHKEFDPVYNSRTSCKMTHPEDQIERLYLEDQKTNRCNLCGQEGVWTDDICFTGYHVTDEEDLEDNHFPTCEEMKCPVVLENTDEDEDDETEEGPTNAEEDPETKSKKVKFD
jgi:hypothetical protein